MTTLDIAGRSRSRTRSSTLSAILAPLQALGSAWVLSRRRTAMRAELEGLSDRALMDIGLSRGDIDTVVDRFCR